MLPSSLDKTFTPSRVSKYQVYKVVLVIIVNLKVKENIGEEVLYNKSKFKVLEEEDRKLKANKVKKKKEKLLFLSANKEGVLLLIYIEKL